jgi:hypothetical protein
MLDSCAEYVPLVNIKKKQIYQKVKIVLHELGMASFGAL